MFQRILAPTLALASIALVAACGANVDQPAAAPTATAIPTPTPTPTPTPAPPLPTILTDPTPTITPEPIPVTETPVKPGTDPTPTSTQTPDQPPTSTPTPGANQDSPKAEIVWPTLKTVDPELLPPGGTVKIEGHGGYLFTPPGYYNESSRSFEIFFDDEPVGSINCYANSCRGSVTLPEGAKPGEHALAVDGGSTLPVTIGATC